MAQPLNKHQITFQEHNRLNSVYAIDGMSLNQPANQIDFNTFDHRRDARLECVVAFSIHAIILVCNLTCSIESTTLLAQCFSLPFMLYDFSPCSSILAKKYSTSHSKTGVFLMPLCATTSESYSLLYSLFARSRFSFIKFFLPFNTKKVHTSLN